MIRFRGCNRTLLLFKIFRRYCHYWLIWSSFSISIKQIFINHLFCWRYILACLTTFLEVNQFSRVFILRGVCCCCFFNVFLLDGLMFWIYFCMQLFYLFFLCIFILFLRIFERWYHSLSFIIRCGLLLRGGLIHPTWILVGKNSNWSSFSVEAWWTIGIFSYCYSHKWIYRWDITHRSVYHCLITLSSRSLVG